MTASPINPDEDRRPVKNPGDEMLTLQEACRFLRFPKAPCATGATSAPAPGASRSAATSATGVPT